MQLLQVYGTFYSTPQGRLAETQGHELQCLVWLFAKETGMRLLDISDGLFDVHDATRWSCFAPAWMKT